MEVGESPGDRDAQSSGRGRKLLFQAQEDRFKLVLRRLQGSSGGRGIQSSSNDVIMQWMDQNCNRAIAAVHT